MSFKANISKEEVQKLALFSFEGEVAIIDNLQTFKKIKEEIFLEPIWGFDTETKPCFKKGLANLTPVSLLQLSSAEKTYLFRLNKYDLQNEVVQLLASPKHTKVGVSIRDDIKALQKLHKFAPSGFLDLQDYANKFGIVELSLKKLAAIVLNVRISKSQQLSNWAADELTEKQIKYAATDSWISREIYLRLKYFENDNT